MRIVTYGAACSLDGFIAGPDGALDWLHFSRDVEDVMRAYWHGVDTVLMGRRTLEAAVALRGGGVYPGMSTFVFSRTLRDSPHPAVQLVREDAGAFVRALKARAGKGICVMGGGELARSLFAAGVIDEVGLNIHPVLLGRGVPMFGDPGQRIGLELAACRTIDGGCVFAMYRVASAGAQH